MMTHSSSPLLTDSSEAHDCCSAFMALKVKNKRDHREGKKEVTDDITVRRSETQSWRGFALNVQNLCQRSVWESLTQSFMYSKYDVLGKNNTKIPCFRHDTEELKILSSETIQVFFNLLHIWAASEHKSWCLWTETVGSMDPMTPQLSLRLWLRWHFHVGRSDALSASQRRTTDQVTAQEKQEDGGETRCHDTKSSGKDVINNCAHFLIRKAKNMRFVESMEFLQTLLTIMTHKELNLLKWCSIIQNEKIFCYLINCPLQDTCKKHCWHL